MFFQLKTMEKPKVAPQTLADYLKRHIVLKYYSSLESWGLRSFFLKEWMTIIESRADFIHFIEKSGRTNIFFFSPIAEIIWP